MHHAQARFVTFCGQLLVTGTVLAIALAALGVLRLDFVGPEDGQADGSTLTPAVTDEEAFVATKPVKPTVREVALTTAPTTAPTKAPATAPTARPSAPSTSASKSSRSWRTVASTTRTDVTGLATVGATWDESDRYPENGIRIDVRTQAKGQQTWSRWQRLEYHDDHGPDTGESEAGRERAGTEPSVIGTVSAVSIRVQTTNGRAPHGIKLALIDPGATRQELAAPAIDTAGGTSAGVSSGRPAGTGQPSSAGNLDLSAMKVSAKPKIFSRAQWGADEKIRDQSAPEYGTIKTGFVHHTVNANDYTKAQVPALLRGIYAYHVEARGWRDIGYNFLVDRFGQIWEGRYGGVDKAVVGAHTLGYNEVSFAMSAIGNYDVAKPPEAVIDAYASLFAWKLSLNGIKANATGLNVKGKTLNAINGHRDVGQTACPGRYLYARLGDIRTKAAAIQNGAGGSTSTPKPKPTPKPTPTPSPTVPAGPTITPEPASKLPARSNVTGSAWPDLIVRQKGTGRILTVPTGGQAGFKPAVHRSGSWGDYDLITAPGDLTGDGRPDLVVRNKASKVTYVMPGDGSGGFSRWVAKTDSLRRFQWLTPAGDFNRDGRPDLIGKSSTGNVYLVPGTRSGKLGSPVLLTSSWSYGAASGAGDLTGDGNPDLVVKSGSTVRLLPGLRTRFARSTLTSVTVAAGDTVLGGDVTADGKGDIVVRQSSGGTLVYPGVGNGRFWAHSWGPFGSLASLTAVTTGNTLGSAGAELIGIDARGQLAMSTFNGLSNTAAPIDSGVVHAGAGQVMNLGDWNGDGKADFGVRPPRGDVMWIRLGTGAGTWGAQVRMGSGFASYTSLAAVGDVTGDGHPDLMGRTAQGLMVIFPGNGKTGFRSAFRAPAALRSFNQLGSQLWKPTTSTGSIILSSDKSFVPVGGGMGSAAKLVGSGYDWVLGAGDLDGDRISDLIVREKATGDLWLIPGTSTGVGPRRFLASGFGGYDLVG